MPFWDGRCTDHSQGRSPNSNIQIYHVLGVLLNELLSGLHLSPMRMVKISSAFTASSRVIRRRYGFRGSWWSPTARGVHLTQTLKRLISTLALGLSPPHLGGHRVPFLVGVGHPLLLASGELIQGGTAE